MFQRFVDGEYYCVDHIVRFYIQEMKLNHNGDYLFDSKAESKLVCYCLYAVTTENIKADFYQPVLVGYMSTLPQVENYIRMFKETHFDFNLGLSNVIPEGIKDPDILDHVLEYCEYTDIGE